MKKALVLGAGGFIGSHLVKKLKEEGYWVRGVDIKKPEYWETYADEFLLYDLRDRSKVSLAMFAPDQDSEDNYDNSFDEVYQLAADMGGAGYLFIGENDADIMHNSMQINLNVLHEASKKNVKRILYTSSACVYPEYNQLDPDNPVCTENSVYPAEPDSEYGWEKLFSERLYSTFNRNKNLETRIARLHGIFGEYGTFDGGKEKAPSAICRKVAEAKDGTRVEVWGDGKQTRSFLHISQCVEALTRIIRSDYNEPFNVGSEQLISMEDFTKKVIEISGKTLNIHYVDGPEGVRGRVSDNTLIEKRLGWKPKEMLDEGVKKTLSWITQVINR